MQLKLSPRQRRTAQDLIPLINIVLLILVFFVVTSNLRSFELEGIALSRTSLMGDSARARNVLVIFADGSLSYAGKAVTKDQLTAKLQDRALRNPAKPLFIAAHAELAAPTLIEIAEMIRKAGVEKIILVTKRTWQR